MDYHQIFSSRFIIDGVPQELTPGAVLAQVSGIAAPEPGGTTLADETAELGLEKIPLSELDVADCLDRLDGAVRTMPFPFSSYWTRCRLAEALMEPLWRKGRFKLGDLCVGVSWKFDFDPIGAKAAFYESVRSLSDYLSVPGVRLSEYSCSGSRGRCTMRISARLSDDILDEDSLLELPYRTAGARLSSARACSAAFVPEPKTRAVFIPFETSEFRLGGSLLAQTLGPGGVSPQIDDPDYFMDCYEVVRELVEDGVFLAAATVRDGGLLPTVRRMASAGTGLDMDLSGIASYYQENSLPRILFSEIPGAVVQLRDVDMDYLDAELLLQDVTYFPLGVPVPGNSAVNFSLSPRSGIQDILDALIRGRGAEGED